MPETIGFIGLGLMGKPMALNLIKNGFSVIAHSRSSPPVDDVVSAGAARAGSPAEIARRCTRIITMVPDSSDVEQVLEGPGGVFEAVQPGTIVIDMSTISPAVTRRLADAARARGATLLDAPVSGGEIGAINASPPTIIDSDASAFAAVTPILRAMGNPERIVRIGESGAGQICKVCNQMVIGGTLTVVSEAIALARKAHVDPAKVREALLGGFAASRVLEVHGERILTGNYKPGFRAKLYAKDYRIAAETLAANASPAPVSSVVKGLVDTLAAEHGDADYSALATVIFEMAGISA